MSDRDYLYGYICRHGSLARSCQVCDLEDEVRRLQAEVAGADENVASWQGAAADLGGERDDLEDGYYVLLSQCHRLEEERNQLRAERSAMLDVIRVADALARRADRTDPLWAMPQIMADLEAALDRFDDLPGDAA